MDSRELQGIPGMTFSTTEFPGKKKTPRERKP